MRKCPRDHRADKVFHHQVANQDKGPKELLYRHNLELIGRMLHRRNPQLTVVYYPELRSSLEHLQHGVPAVRKSPVRRLAGHTQRLFLFSLFCGVVKKVHRVQLSGAEFV